MLAKVRLRIVLFPVAVVADPFTVKSIHVCVPPAPELLMTLPLAEPPCNT